jgi:hypothetical protein
MKCVWTQKVSLLIDGELPPAEARETERHLGLCGDCQAAREDFLLLRRQFAAYPLDADAFARQRALKRILAAGGDRDGLRRAAAEPRRRGSFAGVFGMPRLNPAGLAALLLLLVGLAVGVVSLMSSRRAPSQDVVAHAPRPAPANNHNNSSTATSNTPTPAPDDLTASASQPSGGRVAGNNQKRAGAEAAKGASLDRARVAARVVESARNDRAGVGGNNVARTHDAADANDASDVNDTADVNNANDVNDVNDVNDTRDAARRDVEAARGAGGESKTARHVEQAQLLLRSFRNARPADAGRRASSDLAYEKQRSKKLLYQNIVLRREAASRGNLPVESLLDSLEPILIDIANLPDKPAPADVREINERMRRKNLVAMLQIGVVESAAARSY